MWSYYCAGTLDQAPTTPGRPSTHQSSESVMSGNAPFCAMRMYSSQPCSAVCGVAEYAPVFYHVQQEAFVEDAEVGTVPDRIRMIKP